MAKRKMPPSFRANAQRMKQGQPLKKKGGGTAMPKSRRGKKK